MKTKDYIEKLYSAWPSVPKLAEELSVPAINVYKWRDRNYIPVRYWRELLHAYNGRVSVSDALTIEDLINEETRELPEAQEMLRVSLSNSTVEQ